MTTETANPYEVVESRSSDRMADRVRRLRSRSSSEMDRWLLIAGAVLVPLGIVVILLGYLGASRTPLLFEQIPYLISGGVLGLALVFAGGFTYFAYWHAAGVREARTQHAQLVDALGRLEGLLGGGADAAVSGARTGSFVATASGSLFHRADCSVVAGKTKLRTVNGTEAGLKPCRICDPLADS